MIQAGEARSKALATLRIACGLMLAGLLAGAAGCARSGDADGEPVSYSAGWIHWSDPGEKLVDIAGRYRRNVQIMAELNRLDINDMPGAGVPVYVPPVDEREALAEVLLRIKAAPEMVAINPPAPGALRSGMTSSSPAAGPARELPRDLIMKLALAPQGDGFFWPVKGEILRQFGTAADSLLPGICIAAEENEPVTASQAGTVIFAHEMRGYGQVVIVEHEGGFLTIYGYLDSISVDEGAKVRTGQKLAVAGRPTLSSRPQVFFQIRKDDRPVDPLRLLR